MNNDSHHKELSDKVSFESWLKAEEVPDRPSVEFRQRLAESIENTHPKSHAWKRSWRVIAYASAAALALAFGLYFVENANTPAETVWMTVELELYSALFDPIDSETLSELADLLAYY